MEELVCFRIDNDYLLLNIVLIRFNDITLLFICKFRTDGTLCVALCEDIDNPEYLVIEPEVSDLKKMFHSSLTMRDVFLKQSQYYEIIPGEDVESDNVSIRPGNEIPLDVLPIEGAFFEPVTSDLVEYLNQLNAKDNLENSNYSFAFAYNAPNIFSQQGKEYGASAVFDKSYTVEMNDWLEPSQILNFTSSYAKSNAA